MGRIVLPRSDIATSPVAANTPGRSVDLQHPTAPGFLVKTVDILRDHLHRGRLEKCLKFGNGRMTGIRSRAGKEFSHFIVPRPNPLRVLVKASDTGDRHRINIGPEAVGCVSESRNATLGGHACAGEENNFFGGAKPVKNRHLPG